MANLVQKGAGGKAPEKSKNVAQTCNLLSQYLKGRGAGGFGDIAMGKLADAAKGPEASRTPATTLNLLSNIENSTDKNNDTAPASENIQKPAVEFLPEFVSFGCPSSSPDHPGTAATNPAENALPMTIFYGGKVMLFNDFPADKAMEILALASNGSSNNNNNNVAPADHHRQEQIHQLQPQASGADFPIAPKSSLRRFFDKRKERISAKAPYRVQGNNPAAAAAASSVSAEDQKPEKSKGWIDLAVAQTSSPSSSAAELELKL